jgi:L,D-transpeptidase ErfK/SrfK
MWRIFVLLFMLVVLLPLPAGAATAVPVLYTLVTGGPEEYLVENRVDLTRLALRRGLRPQVLARQNKLKVGTRLQPGTVLTIDDTHIVPAELSHGLVINLPELLLYQFHQGAYQRRYALAVGKKSWPTPVGNFSIRNKAENPVWTVPVSIQTEMENMGREVVEKVPPGPQNPLGKYWLGTTAPGVGIHATNRPWSVGHSVSHGCIRMLPEEIAQLFPQVEVGTPVKIIYQPVKMALTPQGRLYLEAHPDIYGKKIDLLQWVEKVVQDYNLQSRVDWTKIMEVLKTRDGVAREITRDPAAPKVVKSTAPPPAPRKLGVLPLQAKETGVE